MILRARVLLPISAPPIPDGGVRVAHGRIAAVGRWRDLVRIDDSRKIDLGDVVLMPGLVNAHCHLDYTLMAGQFPPPKCFTDWLKTITDTKADWSYSDYAESWTKGAEMLVRSGTTTVGDVEAVPQLLPKMWDTTPLRVCSFLEMIGITKRRLPEAILQEVSDKGINLQHPRCRIGLSPHAPYSTLPELLCLSARTARRRRWLLCTHVAESALEFQMFAERRGEMFDWLARSGRDMVDCGQGSPVRHLERCGILGPNLLAIHMNYLGRGDLQLLQSRRVNVVHCPRSHSYFRHDPFPLRALTRAGVNVCLGTDSLASVYQRRKHSVELSMFEEMRALAEREPGLRPRAILRLATSCGARALALNGKAGEIIPGAHADLIALRSEATPSRVYDTVLEHRGKVSACMIGGRWALAPE
ncbi:MAG TPA: amidohydrolase family protein [Candidatus Limnocylindrales bacterium]|jgi:cytosine/adenosine deaminase-related metal-dependent hydrolase|nr:amidohydrolase family protein [Candidatus Limnocylindrales bacterium]